MSISGFEPLVSDPTNIYRHHIGHHVDRNSDYAGANRSRIDTAILGADILGYNVCSFPWDGLFFGRRNHAEQKNSRCKPRGHIEG